MPDSWILSRRPEISASVCNVVCSHPCNTHGRSDSIVLLLEDSQKCYQAEECRETTNICPILQSSLAGNLGVVMSMGECTPLPAAHSWPEP